MRVFGNLSSPAVISAPPHRQVKMQAEYNTELSNQGLCCHTQQKCKNTKNNKKTKNIAQNNTSKHAKRKKYDNTKWHKSKTCKPLVSYIHRRKKRGKLN